VIHISSVPHHNFLRAWFSMYCWNYRHIPGVHPNPMPKWMLEFTILFESMFLVEYINWIPRYLFDIMLSEMLQWSTYLRNIPHTLTSLKKHLNLLYFIIHILILLNLFLHRLCLSLFSGLCTHFLSVNPYLPSSLFIRRCFSCSHSTYYLGDKNKEKWRTDISE